MRYKILSLLIITGMNVSVAAAKTGEWKTNNNCPSQKNLQAIANQFINSLQPATGVSIAISNPKCGTFNYVIGEANIEKHVPLTSDTKMPIASNTKPILIAIMLKLLEENTNLFPHGLQTKLTEITDKNHNKLFTNDGKLILTDGTVINLADPDFYKSSTGHSFDCKLDNVYQCPQLNTIDLHHLMMESSGLSDVFLDMDLSHTGTFDITKLVLQKLLATNEDSGANDVFTDVSLLKTFGLVKKNNPDPILPMQSHNTDATLLAIILERVTGETLNNLLYEKILKPLKIEKDAMYFLTKASGQNNLVSRRYVYMNTDEEIDSAIAQHQLDKQISVDIAQAVKPSLLTILGRKILEQAYEKDGATYYRPMLDILNLHGQGIIGAPGAGGIIAKPKAYIRFYHALASGSFLNKQSQKVFNSSFLNLPSPNGIDLAMGYGSNILMKTKSGNSANTFLTHAGLVLGGESQVLYHYESGTTIMVATNFSGYFNALNMTFPCFFVTPTTYLDYNAITLMLQTYISQYAQV